MGSVFKKFTAQDKAMVPFNAHKQYNFASASATSNSVTWFTSSWTSESISLYSSASSVYGTNGGNSPEKSYFDVKNTIKYNQIDHLFYRNFKRTVGDKMGPINYLEQPRTLYQKANIISIPSGLYGFEIKPGSFFISASVLNREIIDDKKGNLIISGTNLDNYPKDVQNTVFKLEPVDGFKRYDLSVFSDYASYRYISRDPNFHIDIEGANWRRGKNSPNAPTTYTSTMGKPREIYPENEDDSYFLNKIYYKDVQFTQSISASSEIVLDSTIGSYISSSHNERWNFDKDENFTISFYLRPKSLDVEGIGTSEIGKDFIINGRILKEKRYILAKSGTKTLNTSLSSSAANAEPQYPFEIYHISNSLYFERSDGGQKYTISSSLGESGNYNIADINTHITCQFSESFMKIFENGSVVKEEEFTIKEQTRNTSNLYIGSKGEHNNIDLRTKGIGSVVVGSTFKIGVKTDGGVGVSAIGSSFIIDNYGPIVDKGKFFNGSISNINIYASALSPTQIENVSSSLNGSPYIGNCFYQAGFAVITHPLYQDVFQDTGRGIGDVIIGDDFEIGGYDKYSLNTVQFQGTHLIYEHEYQCTIEEHEFNSTYNLSARKIKSSAKHKLADFTTGSNFSTFVTTVGLYDEKGDCLVVGKLGQPIRMSDETDTTFVLRWDT